MKCITTTDLVLGHNVLLLQMSTKIKTCIEERAAEDTVQEGGLKNNHLLNGVHTHIGIGVFSSEGKLRYVEVGWVAITGTK